MTTAVTVLPRGEVIFSEQATTIRLEDEGAGLFVTVSQDGRDGAGKVSFCHQEWPAIREAIEQQMRMCTAEMEVKP